jgi:hypothetical protein
MVSEFLGSFMEPKIKKRAREKSLSDKNNKETFTLSANALTQNVTNEELPALLCVLHFSLRVKCIM